MKILVLFKNKKKSKTERERERALIESLNASMKDEAENSAFWVAFCSR